MAARQSLDFDRYLSHTGFNENVLSTEVFFVVIPCLSLKHACGGHIFSQ